MTELSILIVSYNTLADLEACLRSIQAHPPRTPHDIIVVDNASTDGTPAALRARWPQVRLIDAGGNLGFAAANNIGIRHSSAPLVVLLNSDTLVPEGVLDGLVAELRGSAELAAVGPRIVDGCGKAELSFGRMMSPIHEARQKFLSTLHQRGVGVITRRVERMTRTRQYVDWVTGACLMVRRDAAIRAGLLDERFFLYTEDIDFCAALRALGLRILFAPQVEIIHLRGRSSATRPAAAALAYRRAHLAFYAKHHPRWTPWLRLYLRVRGTLPPEGA